MSLIANWKIWLFGLLSWLIPFIVSLAFFDSSGQVTIAQPLFKSLMVVIGGGVGAALLVWVFRRIPPTLRSGLIIGTVWLLINLAFDLVVLVPMSGTSIGAYVADIGLRYLMIPIMAVAIGMVAQEARRSDR